MSVTIDGTNGVTASASFYGQSTFTGTYTDGIVVDYTTGTGRITVGAADGLKIRNGGTASPTDLVTVDSSGNVGIGTSSPACRLDVTRTGASAGITAHFTNGDNDAYIYNTNASICKFTGDTSGNYGWGVSSFNGYVAAYTNGSERARIDSSGNLLVGQTATGVLDSSSFSLQGVGTSASIVINHKTGVASGDKYVYFDYAGNIIGSITQNGTTATAYNTSSDYRLKENVQPLTGALARIAALKPCTYTWKSAPDEIGEGFIAHELAEVVPHAVTGEKDAVNEDGSIKPQGIDTSFLVATLTAAIQELNAKVEALEAQLKAA